MKTIFDMVNGVVTAMVLKDAQEDANEGVSVDDAGRMWEIYVPGVGGPRNLIGYMYEGASGSLAFGTFYEGVVPVFRRSK